ncbi:hypothetical protein HK101_000261 [Irineochytrium annulatum]|nr:hypothetical protein HK101_000261 [Irineochytrium annulatum]
MGKKNDGNKKGGPPKGKLKRVAAPLVINFDDKARKEYLTGFHKRKVEKAKKSKLYHQQKAKTELKEMRKAKRLEKKELVKDKLNMLENYNEVPESDGEEEQVQTIITDSSMITVTISDDKSHSEPKPKKRIK